MNTATRPNAGNVAPGGRKRSRGGVATMWVIVGLSIAVCMLCFAAELGNLWLARLQLQTAMEAAALAAVDSWGDAGTPVSTSAHRDRGVDLAEANLVIDDMVVILPNLNTSNPNENGPCTGNLVFGTITSTGPTVFNHNTSPGNCATNPSAAPAVFAQATVTVDTLCSQLTGVGTYNVTASAYARYNCGTGHPFLIHVDQSTCP